MAHPIAEESERERIEAKKRHRPTRAELVRALIERDKDECRYCHRDFRRRERTLDHVYPQSRGLAEGWTYEQVWSLDNLVLACKPCNAKKGDFLLDKNGEIPRRKERTFRYRRDKRAQRAEICTACNAGRDLGPDEICAACQSGPQPERRPRWAKVKSSECDHEVFWCWACSSGIVERTPTVDMILGVGGAPLEGEEEGLVN